MNNNKTRAARLGGTAMVFAGLALAVAGCTAATDEAPTSATSGTPDGGAPTVYDVTLIKGVNGDPFYATMACGAQAEADKLGVNLTVTGGDSWAADVQTPVVNSVIAQGPDAIAVAPNDKTAMRAPLQEVVDQGITLVIVDTGLDDQSMASSVISSDNELGGKLAADALAEQIGGKGTVFVMNVKAGISTTDLRAQGFLDQMATAYPDIVVLETQYNEDDAGKAASITTSQLAANPEIAGIFATNVIGAEGTATGLKQAGKQGTVKLIGYDAGPKQVEELKAGTFQGLVAQDPYTEGVQAVRQAYAALSGGAVEEAVRTELAVLTADNLEENKQFLYLDSCE